MDELVAEKHRTSFAMDESGRRLTDRASSSSSAAMGRKMPQWPELTLSALFQSHKVSQCLNHRTSAMYFPPNLHSRIDPYNQTLEGFKYLLLAVAAYNNVIVAVFLNNAE